MLLSHVIDQFLQERIAARYSPNTIRDYKVTFNKLLSSIGDMDFENISKQSIIRFIASLNQISAKTLRNHHADLSALWRWAMIQGYCQDNLISHIHPPIAERKAIIPLSREEISALIQAASMTKSPLRDQAIILLLLDTGMRASELCSLKVGDINWTANYVVVIGKGRKQRQLPISKVTMQLLKKYLECRKSFRPSDSVFITSTGNVIDRSYLLKMINKLGKKANVPNVHPHRLRHTFAIQFLRNGGTIYSLQQILGHTTLEMVKRYLMISQVDINRDHQTASPVKNWHLDLMLKPFPQEG